MSTSEPLKVAPIVTGVLLGTIEVTTLLRNNVEATSTPFA
jgi:hypothetical protein